MLVYKEHASHLIFGALLKAKKFLTLCLPPSRIHVIQALDVGVFGPLNYD